MKRIFIAVKVVPDEKMKSLISSLRDDLKGESIKWVKPENFHLTLVFLGDTEESKIDLIREMLSEKCAGFGSFDLQLKGSGVFKNPDKPKVLWMGTDETERFNELHRAIFAGLLEKGIKIQEGPFKPHLTLGRIKKINDRENLIGLLAKYRDLQIQKIDVTEVVLYESILNPDGPVYNIIGRFSL